MADGVLRRKARNAQLIYEDLLDRTGMDGLPVTFVADEGRRSMLSRACCTSNPFPIPLSLVLTKLRIPAVRKLFEDEIIPQTSAIAAVLTACSAAATEIAALRGADVSNAQIRCDLVFSGLQAIRLYMSDHKHCKEFTSSRVQSALRVNNALNGSMHKFRARDGRDVSFHVYYQSQQEKLVKALGLSKKSEEYKFFSLKKDMKEIAANVASRTAMELEDLSFDCGACGCMIRSREEWESSEVGKAVIAMPLIRTEKLAESEAPDWGRPTERGPLSGIRVLDLTHIIAGPACSRILAEYGADVLLVRRGDFRHQEQAMLEFDGWAGKHSIQLDFNIPEQLERAKQLIREADIVTYSYQNGCMDKFGLSEADIRALNPNVIYSNLNCFSDTVWKDRPGWAPCAEDITGLSVRNGSLEEPKNLNGVPLDYFPGFILALGTLRAIAQRLKEGGGYKVTTSLTRGAQYLHECADLCENSEAVPQESSVAVRSKDKVWDNVFQYVKGCASGGECGFSSPPVVNTAFPLDERNLVFTDGCTGWSQN